MDKIIYEQPLNERVRTFLRLELLFDQVAYHLRGQSAFESRVTINHLIDILSFFNRTELKSEVTKELERHATILSRLEKSPDVDQEQLGHILNKIDPLIDKLHATTGLLGQNLKKNDFLNGLRQRNSIAGGSCSFDLPVYHYWLSRPAEQRIHDLSKWLAEFDTIGTAIHLILNLIRDSARPGKEIALEGVFHKSLDPNLPCQMIRVGMNAEDAFFPEISAGKHRFSVRFLRAGISERATQIQNEVAFELTTCVI